MHDPRHHRWKEPLIASLMVLAWGCGGDVETGSSETTAETAEALVEPMLDGLCSEYGEPRLQLAEDVPLYVRQTRDHVWLCYSLPPESYGTLDLRVETPALPEALNLHISAQLGEWPASKPDDVEVTWWNQRGWFGNAVAFAGLDDEDRARFADSAGRELQLSLERFGRGTWQLWFDVGHIGSGEDARELRVPAADAPGIELEIG